MKRIARRPWMLPLLVAVLTAAIGVGVIVTQLTGGSGASNAAPIATACDNFAQASELFARGGSEESLGMTGGHVFTRDAQADSKQILRDLMDACDTERATR